VSPPGGSDLPNTGGPNLIVLLGGLVLLVTGATAVTFARRRAEEAEIQASRA
jgi:LPXTG-motif cell wall-anchored protein